MADTLCKGLMKVNNQVICLLRDYKQEIPDNKYAELLDSGIVDSFDIVNIIALIEKKFQISIEAEDILPENFKSVDEISRLVERYLNK